MVTVFLSLGGNTRTKNRDMENMLEMLSTVLLQPIKRSRLMDTEPVEVSDKQEWYLNCIVSGGYAGTAGDLLDKCRKIEDQLGRVRPYRHCSRTADIDILLFGDAIVNDSNLCLPHPGLFRRRFCLEGVKELSPGLIFPGRGLSVSAYYEAMDETIKKQKINFIDS
jgi:2-amino-4-hydroxy-6-hydroxymethyldihydropteridine diphosphokinase